MTLGVLVLVSSLRPHPSLQVMELELELLQESILRKLMKA